MLRLDFPKTLHADKEEDEETHVTTDLNAESKSETSAVSKTKTNTEPKTDLNADYCPAQFIGLFPRHAGKEFPETGIYVPPCFDCPSCRFKDYCAPSAISVKHNNIDHYYRLFVCSPVCTQCGEERMLAIDDNPCWPLLKNNAISVFGLSPEFCIHLSFVDQ